MQVLKKVDGIAFCELTSKDVVRHPLVQQIVQAYEVYEKKHKPSTAETGGQRNNSRRDVYKRQKSRKNIAERIHF